MSQQPQLCQKCVSGVEHEGQAKGKIIKVGGDFEAYEAVPSKDYDKSKVLLLLTDVFGIELNNNKLLADSFADNGIRTLIPEYLQKDPIPKDALSGGNFDLMAWLGKHGAETVNPALNAAVEHVKGEGVKSIGAIGYCFGGRYVFNLAFEKKIQVAAVAHPSLLQVPEDLEKYKSTGVPLLVISNGPTDFQFDLEKSKKADEVLGPLGSDKYVRKYWDGLDHGFAVRGDMSDPKQKKAKEEAFEEATNWFLSKL